MADSFRADASALIRLAGSYQGAASALDAETAAWGERTAMDLEREGKREAPAFRGHLRRSITRRVRLVAGGVRAIAGTNIPYARDLEEGRRPANPPTAADLLPWVRHKRLPDEAAFPIARKIARVGPRANPFFARALAAVKPRAVEDARLILPRALRRMGGAP